MRNRKVRRELRRGREEKLDMRNYVGISDPTPYQAVQNIRRHQIAEAKPESSPVMGRDRRREHRIS